MRSNVVFRWLWLSNIKHLANEVYVCKSCMEYRNTVNVNNWMQLFSQMYSHVQLNHHIPTDAQTRDQKEEKTNRQTRKDVQLPMKTRERLMNMRIVSYVSVSEQMLEWWMIHNSGGFKQSVRVSTLHFEVRMLLYVLCEIRLANLIV